MKFADWRSCSTRCNHPARGRSFTWCNHPASNWLKQAPRAWHSKITLYLHNISFKMSKSDKTLYIRNNSKSPVFIILYVGDLVIGGESPAKTQKPKKLLSEKLEEPERVTLFSWHQGYSNSRRIPTLTTTLCVEPILQVWNEQEWRIKLNSCEPVLMEKSTMCEKVCDHTLL